MTSVAPIARVILPAVRFDIYEIRERDEERNELPQGIDQTRHEQCEGLCGRDQIERYSCWSPYLRKD